MNSNVAHLFQPLSLRGITLPNRIALSPMCQYSAEDGFAKDWHVVHYGSRAVGGAGLIIVEATAVQPRGRISPYDLGLWDDDHIEPLRRIVELIQKYGAVPGIQIGHAGRKASARRPWDGRGWVPPEQGGWNVVGPSALPFSPGAPMPEALDKAGLDGVEQAFVGAANRALQAGFEVVEVHAAHGYLLHQFLSPVSNRREDEYGGSLENRMRFPLRIARSVREAWPDSLPVFVRVSATDWVQGGWSPDDTVVFSRRLRELGIDLIDVSSGGSVPDAVIPTGPDYQVPFAAQIRTEAGVATGAVGLITEVQQAETILATGKADLVLLGRKLLRDPYWPLHAARQLGADVPWPPQYLRGKR